jgi:hypothetical protein
LLKTATTSGTRRFKLLGINLPQTPFGLIVVALTILFRQYFMPRPGQLHQYLKIPGFDSEISYLTQALLVPKRNSFEQPNNALAAKPARI